MCLSANLDSLFQAGNVTAGPACAPCVFDVISDPNEHIPIKNSTLLKLLQDELALVCIICRILTRTDLTTFIIVLKSLTSRYIRRL